MAWGDGDADVHPGRQGPDKRGCAGGHEALLASVVICLLIVGVGLFLLVGWALSSIGP